MNQISDWNSEASPVEPLDDSALAEVSGGCAPRALLGGTRGSSPVVFVPPCPVPVPMPPPKRMPPPGRYTRGRGWVDER